MLQKVHAQFAHPTKTKFKKLMIDGNMWMVFIKIQ